MTSPATSLNRQGTREQVENVMTRLTPTQKWRKETTKKMLHDHEKFQPIHHLYMPPLTLRTKDTIEEDIH